MAWYPEATRCPTPNYGGTARAKQAVVLHIAEGSRAGVRSHFKSRNSRVSSNFLVAENGDVDQFVDSAETAWANGARWDGRHWFDPQGNRISPTWPGMDAHVDPNSITISIEFEGYHNQPRPDAQLNSARNLIKWCAVSHGFPLIAGQTITTHAAISPVVKKGCPGIYIKPDMFVPRGGL